MGNFLKDTYPSYSMGIEKIFYIIGILFAISAVVYFTWEYILSFTKEIKTALLAALVIFFFSLGALMKEKRV